MSRMQPSTLSHRRGRSLTSMSIPPSDENLDLFSRSRRSVSLASSDDSSDASSSVKLGILPVGSEKVARAEIDNLLLSSSEGVKHDYDWLLTPPGTPSIPSSYTRPSSPITRSSFSARPPTTSARSTASQSSTPSRVHPTSRSSSAERPRPSHISATVSSPAAPRQSSRPYTPIRRSSTPPSPINSTGTSKVIQNGRTPAPTSRLGSPSLRPHPPPQPIIPPGFPLETPPNLRTTLPERPLSAGRSRTDSAVTVKGNHDTATPRSLVRRQLSPVIARGRLVSADTNGRTRDSAKSEPQKALISPELGTRKPVKTATSLTDRTGFGRLISKNSLDVTTRHMDTRNGTGTIRALSGTTRFPQSIRSSASKTQSIRAASALTSVNMDANHLGFLDNSFLTTENGVGMNKGRFSAKTTDLDIYESSRYEAMLLREDSRNTNWLHSFDDKSDQGSIFESGLEFLSEPFDPL